MDGTVSLSIQIVNMENSSDSQCWVTLYSHVEGRIDPVVQDSFELGNYEIYQHPSDWIRDMIVMVAERF